MKTKCNETIYANAKQSRKYAVLKMIEELKRKIVMYVISMISLGHIGIFHTTRRNRLLKPSHLFPLYLTLNTLIFFHILIYLNTFYLYYPLDAITFRLFQTKKHNKLLNHLLSLTLIVSLNLDLLLRYIRILCKT